MHAFIIEDDYLISRSIQDMLGDLGFTAFSFARSEDAAVAGASGDRFDLITAEVRLLPGDGVRAAEAIGAGSGTPVVFTTGYADELRDRLGGRLPPSPIVQKPIKAAELKAAVRQVLPTPAQPHDPASGT